MSTFEILESICERPSSHTLSHTKIHIYSTFILLEYVFNRIKAKYTTICNLKSINQHYEDSEASPIIILTTNITASLHNKVMGNYVKSLV